jgi:hypothetical protein
VAERCQFVHDDGTTAGCCEGKPVCPGCWGAMSIADGSVRKPIHPGFQEAMMVPDGGAGSQLVHDVVRTVS